VKTEEKGEDKDDGDKDDDEKEEDDTPKKVLDNV